MKKVKEEKGIFGMGIGKLDDYYCKKCGKKHSKESDIGFKHLLHEKKKTNKK